MKSRTPKTLFIKCRVTPGDRERLHELMRKTGHRSEASFIRDAVFKDKPITIPTSSPTDDEILQKMNDLIREFNRIGINYNQIAVKVNTASIPMAQALQESDKTFREVQQSLAQARDALHAYLTDPNKRL